MQHDIRDLHARIDELMKFCVAGKKSFIPSWSEESIEIGCQKTVKIKLFYRNLAKRDSDSSER